jgi:YbbR domain-containing protein
MFLLNGRTLLARVAENWPVKVISLAMAIGLFVFHRMSLLEERFFSVPLSVETDTRLIPASSYPGMIKITLRGDANTIYPVLEEDIQAYIDLNQYTEPGTYRAPVRIHKKGTALRAEALEILVDPIEVVLILDERLSKTVPVKANFRGAIEMGYEMGEYTLDPAHVVIDGPMGLLKDISELSTDFVELTGRSVDFSTTVRILNDEPLIVIRGNGLIEFRATIREQLWIQNIDNIPIRINGLEEEFSGELEITIGSVRIEGGQTMFEKLRTQDVGLYVDCSSINDEGDFLLPVFVLFPTIFTLIRHDPQNVLIHIRRWPPTIIESGGS